MRIAYSEANSDRKYSFDATKMKECTIRAYVTYIDANENSVIVYSNQIDKQL